MTDQQPGVDEGVDDRPLLAAERVAGHPAPGRLPLRADGDQLEQRGDDGRAETTAGELVEEAVRMALEGTDDTAHGLVLDHVHPAIGPGPLRQFP